MTNDIFFKTSDSHKTTRPTIVQLAKGGLEEVQFKGHEYCMRLTSTLQGERSVYLSFEKESEYRKWLKKAKKVCTMPIFSKNKEQFMFLIIFPVEKNKGSG